MKTNCLLFLLCLSIFAVSLIADAAAQNKTVPSKNLKDEVREFLDMYNRLSQPLYAVSSEAEWLASTDVTEEHTGQRIGANETRAAFEGSVYIINKTKEFLKHTFELDDLSVRQLQAILYTASSYPGTIPDVVRARVGAEARQGATLDGFRFCYEYSGDSCIRVVTPN